MWPARLPLGDAAHGRYELFRGSVTVHDPCTTRSSAVI